MSILGLKCFNEKLLVVGPIYDQIDKLSEHSNWFSDHDQVIFNGNLCYPNHNLDQVRERIKTMNKYLQFKNIIYNLGDQDLILMKKLWESGEAPDILRWLCDRNNVIMIDFAYSQSTLIVTSGGITPKMARSGLQDNLEISFVNHLGGRPWHELYGGGCGYIIANNPLTQNRPIFYNHSIQIGTIYNTQTTVYAVQAHSRGLGNIFSL
jgi:hypothetical protein